MMDAERRCCFAMPIFKVLVDLTLNGLAFLTAGEVNWNL